MEPVVFINAFTVPAGREQAFFALWREVNDYMRGQPGYISHRLHRSLSPDARFRFINVAVWQSPAHWERAHDDGFQALVRQPAWAEFPPQPALYEVVHAGSRAGDAATPALA